MTVILNVTSNDTDLERYAGLLKPGDALIDVTNLENESIVKRYNEIVAGTDEQSDILLLSDNIKLHDGFIDSMNSCLYAAEKHSIVYGQEIVDNKSLIETAKKYLPNYTITIKANAHCALIKRNVISTLGFLDEAYDSLHYALMDYYCKVNKFGFSSVTSHNALFSYKSELAESNHNSDKEIFASRYEHWADKEWRHLWHGSHPCIEFLELIDNDYYPKKRILFDCSIMPTHHCGTSEYQISIFDAFNRLFGDKYDIFMLINHEADEYFKLSDKYVNVIYPETIKGIFHLWYTPNQVMQIEPQLTMNKHSLKSVQTMFDIMMVRIDEHFYTDVNSDVELGIRFCDGIVFISDYTKSDFLACFSNESSVKQKPMKVIYPATDLTTAIKEKYDLPFEEYFLVVGSSFKHKAIEQTIKAVSESKYCFIVIGSDDIGYISDNIYGYKGGRLDENFLSYLYSKCKAVIFPSLYEGFGLPVAISLKNNKRVIIYDNALNRELLDHFNNFKYHFLFFDKFEQINDIFNNVDFSSTPRQVEYDDSWDRVAVELESFFESILTADVDPDGLYERWHLYKLIEARLTDAELRVERQKAELSNMRPQYNNSKLFPSLRFAVKEYVKNRHPRLFSFLKRIRP